MTHRREQIMERVETLVTGLATTGANVFRSRPFDLPPDVAAAIHLRQGEDELQARSTPNNVKSLLAVHLHIVVSTAAEDYETIANQSALEVTRALAADYRLGLANIVETAEEVGTVQPTEEGSGEKATARLELVWSVLYERLIDDPEN